MSVTDNMGGIFSVKVYNSPKSSNDAPVKKALIDTYYGYVFTPLYFNTATRKIVADASQAPLYKADPAKLSQIPANELAVNGFGTQYYTTNAEYALSGGQASGWLEAEGGEANSLFQVPVISMTNLPNGTYYVEVEARFSDMHGHYSEDENGNKFYNLVVDGIRIYDPAKNNAIAAARYLADSESNVEYFSFRDKLLETEGATASLLLIDGKQNLTQNDISAYLDGAPKKELYLAQNGTVAFDIDASGSTDVKIGLKSANGKACKAQIVFNSGQPMTVDVNTSSEQYVSIKSLVGSGSGTLSVRNSSSDANAVLAVTNLMVTSGSAQASAPALRMSVKESTYANALAQIDMLNADLAIDEESINTISADDGTITLTLKTSEDAETVVVRDADGNVVDPESIEFTVDETGVKNWTIILAESESGVYTYTLQAEYENGYAPEEPTTVTVTVTIHEPEDTSIGGRLDKIRGLFARLIELIRQIIALFK